MSSSTVSSLSLSSEDEDYDTTARAVLTEDGFDPEDLKKVSLKKCSRTPLIYYSYLGDVTMVRYLIAHGADCRKTDQYECTPLYWAAMYGRLEIMKLLSQDGGAHEDIRKVTVDGWSPLRIALHNGYFHVAQWLILNGALASRDDNVIDDMVMQRDLRQQRNWRDDRRRTVLSWARDAVATYDQFQLFVTGTILFPDEEVPGVLEIIADYVAGTQPQLRTLRQLIDRLPAFIDDVPFIER